MSLIESSTFDIVATIGRLFVYPVKSCAGIELQEAWLTETGLEFDRAWMVVDARGDFVTQRELPRMALIRPALKHSELVLRAPGMLALHLALDAVESAARVRLWDEEVAAYDMGLLAAQWLTDFLQPTGRVAGPLRLVRFDPDARRLSSLKWTGGLEALNQFNDGFPVLVCSDESLNGLNARLQRAGHAAVGIERFRPNLVLHGINAHDEDRVGTLHIPTVQGEVGLQPVKPCPRCLIPNVHPGTGIVSTEVGDTLAGYRYDDRLGGAVTFGMNAIVAHGVGGLLRVGQPVGANYQFD